MFQTFNYGNSVSTEDQHLRNQNYRICIRQEEGYCCIVYMKCDSTAFEINPGPQADSTKAFIGSNCSQDYINIEGSNQGGVGNVNVNDRYCGGIFSNFNEGLVDAKIKDCTAPFEVGVITDAATDGTASDPMMNSGKFDSIFV